MTSITLNNKITIVNDNCLNHLKTLPDNCLDLIIIDPPYYKIKRDKWDNQWDSVEHYLAWLDDIFSELWRVLKPQGSFYCFCSPRLSAETEILIKQRFNVLNHVVWSKPTGAHKQANKESLHSYISASECIIFAEHYNAEGFYKGQVGYAIKCDELRRQVFKPLIDYFINAKNTLGITAKEIQTATKTQMYKHWFSYSQWELPTEERYKQLYDYFDKVAKAKGIDNPFSRPYSDITGDKATLKDTYITLTQQYSHLKKQYEQLRRPFSVTAQVPYTDVWEFMPVQYYPGKHPCEKPKALIEHMIKSSSREGDIVADFFMGSGSTAIGCIDLNRQFLGCEMDNNYYQNIVKKLQSIT